MDICSVSLLMLPASLILLGNRRSRPHGCDIKGTRQVRQNYRQQERQRVLWKIEAPQNGAWHGGTVLDFSGGGIRFVSPCAYTRGSEVLVRVRPDTDSEYELRLRIIWVSPAVMGATKCGATVLACRALVSDMQLKLMLEKRFARLWRVPPPDNGAEDKAA